MNSPEHFLVKAVGVIGSITLCVVGFAAIAETRSFLSPAFANCSSEVSNISEEWLDCLSDEREHQEQLLAGVEQKLQRKLVDLGLENAAALQILQERHAIWKNFADSECEYYFGVFAAGPTRGPDLEICKVRATIERRHELEKELEE
ncbi:lysozyme inhibitor LprI family protein [Pseudophaeobacter sp. TrK17]|uniref:lysozyme inhibitor LprI family protein n=1 Tax=Pseudophaeobacter sp. TrK17 TaxID=2815167 RepID=UPI0035CF4409